MAEAESLPAFRTNILDVRLPRQSTIKHHTQEFGIGALPRSSVQWPSVQWRLLLSYCDKTTEVVFRGWYFEFILTTPALDLIQRPLSLILQYFQVSSVRWIKCSPEQIATVLLRLVRCRLSWRGTGGVRWQTIAVFRFPGGDVQRVRHSPMPGTFLQFEIFNK